ncbi:Protein kinase domain/Protein tyrosine kinase, putative [Angomonas deanei]|uniref:cyclin-dependent kinase n=1 Tax=Angomonas deanei TaxID=59799 RepID=A0A7G2CAS7_9TRYP|nr:Protein kinase domain/Protein tyrosine kinase, putative [Angomonas deanei]
MEAYETLGVLGEGTYGVVVKARHRATRRLVAIKKFKQSDENDEHVRKTSLREVRVLKNLHHLNVVSLLDVFRRDGKLFLVFEYIEYTVLQRLEQTSKGLPPLEVKKFMYQLLRGLDYCHAHNIIHRDVKPENILVTSGEELDSGETGNETSKNILKICDFGFARHLSSKGNYTDYVATRWYRAPELLVGDTNYNKGVDIWAVGCLLAELTDTQPLFPGDSDLDQLTLILQTCGMVPPSMIDIFESNPYYRRVKFPHHASVRITLRQRYCKQSEEWLQFIEACLQTDPANRPSCLELMNFPYFTKDGFKYEYEAELQRITAAAYPNLSSSVSHQNNNNNNAQQQRRPQNASAQSFAEVSLTELITSKQFLSNQRASDDSALPNINATSKNSTMNNHQNNNNNKFSSTASSPTYGNSSSNLNNNNNNNFRRPSESINLMLMGGSNANTNNASLSSLNNPSVGSNNTGLPQLSALWNQYLGNNNNNPPIIQTPRLLSVV